MERVVIDSSGWIEYSSKGRFFEKFAAVVRPASPLTHFTPSIVIYEVFKKIAREADEKIALEVIALIGLHTSIVVLSPEIAIEAAKESSAEGLPMADAIIYATAKRNGAKLYTSDAHFKDKKGVHFIE